MHCLNVLHQLGPNGDGRKVLGVFRTVAHCRYAPQHGAFVLEKIEGSRVQTEKLGHLTQRAMQRIAEIQ